MLLGLVGGRSDSDGDWVRKFDGGIVLPKPETAVARIAERIKAADPDVLAVEEVEDRETLRKFNEEHLGGVYSECILVEGNDERGIDVGILSKLPIGEINSYQRERHDKLPGEPVYRRDLLLVEVLSPDRRKRLLWVGVTHFKSQFIDWRIKDESERQKAAEEASRLRLYEAEMTANILRSSTNEERFVLCGDLNDVPDSEALTPLLGRHGRQAGLVNVLAQRQSNELERWTTTHKQTGEERQFDQYDYLLVPEFMSDAVTKAWVQRRSTGHCEPDGSDHDPVFCELAL